METISIMFKGTDIGEVTFENVHLWNMELPKVA